MHSVASLLALEQHIGGKLIAVEIYTSSSFGYLDLGL